MKVHQVFIVRYRACEVNVLSAGAFGHVYRGVLRLTEEAESEGEEESWHEDNGTLVAVKTLKSKY